MAWLNYAAIAISIATFGFYLWALRKMRRTYEADMQQVMWRLALSERRRIELENLLMLERQSPLWSAKRRGPEIH